MSRHPEPPPDHDRRAEARTEGGSGDRTPRAAAVHGPSRIGSAARDRFERAERDYEDALRELASWLAATDDDREEAPTPDPSTDGGEPAPAIAGRCNPSISRRMARRLGIDPATLPPESDTSSPSRSRLDQLRARIASARTGYHVSHWIYFDGLRTTGSPDQAGSGVGIAGAAASNELVARLAERVDEAIEAARAAARAHARTALRLPSEPERAGHSKSAGTLVQALDALDLVGEDRCAEAHALLGRLEGLICTGELRPCRTRPASRTTRGPSPERSTRRILLTGRR